MEWLEAVWAWFGTLPKPVLGLLAVVGVVLTAFGIFQAFAYRRSDKAQARKAAKVEAAKPPTAFVWVDPTWKRTALSQKGTLRPVLRVDFPTRGTSQAQGVVFDVMSPARHAWVRAGTSVDTIDAGKGRYWYIDMINGSAFNAHFPSPWRGVTDDRTGEAKPGTYGVRITWFDAATPAVERINTFTYEAE